jgi:hypothetical protein
MEKLLQKPLVFPKKVAPPVKAKRRSTAVAVKMSSPAEMEELFASAAGCRSAIVMTGARKNLPKGAFRVARRLAVQLESFHNFQSSTVNFIFVVMSGKETEEDLRALADLGDEFLVKTEDDEYQSAKTISKSILDSSMFWSPKFNRETLKRFALAAQRSLENIYVRDVVLEQEGSDAGG